MAYTWTGFDTLNETGERQIFFEDWPHGQGLNVQGQRQRLEIDPHEVFRDN